MGTNGNFRFLWIDMSAFSTFVGTNGSLLFQKKNLSKIFSFVFEKIKMFSKILFKIFKNEF